MRRRNYAIFVIGASCLSPSKGPYGNMMLDYDDGDDDAGDSKVNDDANDDDDANDNDDPNDGGDANADGDPYDYDDGYSRLLKSKEKAPVGL